MVPKDQSVAPGAEAKFQLKATGDCPKFQWKKDYENLHDGVKYCGTHTDTLRIKDVEKSDKGCYQCLMKNSDGEKLSHEAKLTVSKWVLRIIIYSIIYTNCSFSNHSTTIYEISSYECKIVGTQSVSESVLV